MSKAAVIRQVQLAFLNGDIGSDEADAENRGGLMPPNDTEENEVPDWQHPYYWAPFILMGNWL